MPDLKAALTEALREHRIVITGYRDQPMCCSCQEGCSRNGHMLTMDADEFPAHLADVLLALPGVAVIQLPEPCGCGNEWIGGREKVFYTAEDEITDVSIVAPVTGSGEAQLVFVEDPRGLASALLAAAVLSEGER